MSWRDVFRHGGPSPMSSEGHLPGFDRATGWLNSPPLSAADVAGKVVIVDFWTYTCINWLRTLSYVRAWAEKYHDRGLVTVGVHTPEFPFEQDVDNVRQAVKDMRIEYPIAIDSDYGVWRAFSNQYWPAVYIADAQGRIRPQKRMQKAIGPLIRTRPGHNFLRHIVLPPESERMPGRLELLCRFQCRLGEKLREAPSRQHRFGPPRVPCEHQFHSCAAPPSMQ